MLTDAQKIYDKIVGHMRQQGNPWGSASRRDWTYINPNNPCQRCAQGVLMDVEWEQAKIPKERSYCETLYRLGELHARSVVASLQMVFELRAEAEWENEFERIAKRFNLVYTEPKSKLTFKERIYNALHQS